MLIQIEMNVKYWQDSEAITVTLLIFAVTLHKTWWLSRI